LPPPARTTDRSSSWARPLDDASARVEQKHAGAELVESIGQCRGFRGLAFHGRADQHRAAQVRSDQTHALAHLVVGYAIPFLTEDAEEGHARRRFLADGPCKVHQVPRRRPLLVEASIDELVIGKEIDCGDGLLDLGEEFAGDGRIELGISVEVELLVVRVESIIVIVDVQALLSGIPRIDRRRRAADEVAGLAEDLGPQRRIECRIVDVADERQDRFSLWHWCLPRRLCLATRVGKSS
jgi:hypothetical protein